MGQSRFDRKALGQLQERADRYHAGLTDEMSAYLEARGIGRDVAHRFRLGRCDDVHEGWLSIPYLRAAGTVWLLTSSSLGGFLVLKSVLSPALTGVAIGISYLIFLIAVRRERVLIVWGRSAPAASTT